MPILVRNIPLGLDDPEEKIIALAAKRLRVSVDAVRTYSIVRRSLDARKKDLHYSYHVEVALDEPPQRERDRLNRLGSVDAAWIEPRPVGTVYAGDTQLRQRPVVVGFGPAGMFAALRLAQHGYRPLVLERGRDVRRRHRDVMHRYFRERDFDSCSNVLFGEGGAGTYSDGKIYTRVSDPLCRLVLEIFYQHGADPDILINTRPHIGSDRLPTICRKIREKIQALGGEIRFECLVDDIRLDDGVLTAIHVCNTNSDQGPEWMPCGPVVFACGHSARDTIRMFSARGITIEPKAFQIGVRIEHPQEMVDHWQYGTSAGHQRLAPAEYHSVAKGAAGEHGNMFSFCMCPGGMILPANESEGLIATNGASKAQRSGPFANSGLVITTDPASMGLSALEALDYQEKWERLAFEATGGSYSVPCQRAHEFLRHVPSEGTVETSFPLGGKWVDMRSVVPKAVYAALERGLPMFERKFPGFAGANGLITGPETRASAPIRILRDPDTRQATKAAGLYPVGEGAGYAGGIVSAAVDGIRTSDAIIGHYAPLA